MVQKEESPAPMGLEEWLNKRASWLRKAADGLSRNRQLPSEAELEELTTHCLAEAAKTPKTTYPLLTPGAILGTPGAGALRIDSIGNICGVNAIGREAVLDLKQGHMSVVYGANGSGKSGYARLMKHICGARAKGDIHGNVFDKLAEDASAQVKITNYNPDGSILSTSDIAWTKSNGQYPKLNAVPVFDSATALELGDTPSTATHLPRAMRFVGLLIKISDLVNERLKNRSAHLACRLPAIPQDHTQTQAVGYLQKLNQKLTEEEIDNICTIPEESQKERLALETSLAQANPAEAHAKLVGNILRLKTLEESVSELRIRLNDDQVSAVILARQSALNKRHAANTYATSFLAGLPLQGVGEAVWRNLWDAARKYSSALAYPESHFPHTGEDARCVLCQQSLEEDGKERLLSFEKYLSDNLQTEAKTAENTLDALTKALPNAIQESNWQSICNNIGLNVEQATTLAREFNARLKALCAATDVTEVPAVNWKIWTDAYTKTVEKAIAERDALAVLLDPAGRAGKENRLRELRAQEWLAGQVEAIKAEVVRLKKLSTVEAALQLTHTRQLTLLSNEIGERELARGYCDRFNKELSSLGGQAIPVQMGHKAAGKGNYSFFLQLKGAEKSAKNRDVLSEGEQRIVALAAFLADATGSDRGLPVIFDDPISSLDQRYEETVAKRLISLADNRQVIVFTHRVSLMVLLGSFAEQRLSIGLSPIDVNVASIARDGASTGMPATIDVFSLKPKVGFNQMVSNIGAFKKYDPQIRKLALKDACSNFRILIERSVEDHLCSGVINRYRREINTLGKLNRLNAITLKDCAIINEMMSKYSAFEHSQPTDTPAWLPELDELLADVQSMLNWIKDFDSRAKAEVEK